MSRKLLLFALLVLVCLPLAAQRTEIAVLGGVKFPQGTGSFTVERSAAAQINVAERIAHVPLIAAYLEVPIVFGVNSSLKAIGNPTSIPQNYNSLFITPGIRVKFAPISPVSPFLAAGVGYARLNSSNILQNQVPNPHPTSNSAIFDLAGGVDFKIFPFLSFRAEVRDFYVGLPTGGGLSSRQHTVVPSGGLVLRF